MIQTKNKATMKKLIKRLEELAIENDKLRNVIEEYVIDCFKEKFKDSIFKQMDDTGVVLDGIIGSFKDSGKVEERPKTTSTYEDLGSQDFKKEENKELEEAKEILKDWRFGKCTYSSDEIDIAIETILNHLDNENKN